MKLKKYLFAIACLLIFSSRGQSQSMRGMYINNFDDILGNTVMEDSLLMYLQDSSYNYMALYDLHTLDFSSSSDMNMLSAFIVKARQQYGIPYVGAVGETSTFFTNKIKSYNNSRTSADEKFNVFNLEFEFWTTSSVQPGGYYCVSYLQAAGCSCDTAGAFQYYMSLLNSIDSLADTQGAISETYLGWFNQGQGQQIQAGVDRILLHAYRVDNSSVWGYSKTRLGYLASNNQMVNVAPIFSSEPDFMGPWLQNHGQLEAYDKYETDFNADNSSWKQYINLLGYHWFTWSHMPKPVPGAGGAAPSISASGSTSFCPGGLVTLTATLGTSYSWSNGETTRSINVGTSGNYTCDVTQGGSTQTTNSIAVTVYTPPTVSLIVNTPVNNSVPLTSNAVAGSGSITSYEWKMNNIMISGATNSEYTATESGNYSLIATNSYGCNNSSAVESVVVPTTQCILTVPSNPYEDEITEASAMIHWDSLPAADSIIIRYKVEASTEYIYVRLAYAEQVSFLITGLEPGIQYSWRMKTVCGTSTGSYSVKRYFTTSSTQTGIQEEASHESTAVIVYPNPATTNIHIAVSSDLRQQAFITISDMAGKIILSEDRLLDSGENAIAADISNLANGIYLLTLRTEKENIVKRFSVE